MRTKEVKIAWGVVTAVAFWAAVASAEEAPSLHAFGGAGYGINDSDDNHYDASTPDGNYGHATLSLSVAASPTDKLRVSGQIHFESGEGGHHGHHGEEEEGALDTASSHVDIDLAFAEWRVSDAFRLRAGRIKQTFGIYNEIFDVGTLRPFSFLPKGLYGAGVLAEGLNGVGFGGSRRSGGWRVQYDAYFGGLQVEEELLTETLGGRVVAETPVTGLSFGASGYSGASEEARHWAVGGHGEYVTGPWSLRAEYLHASLHGDVTMDSAYVEAARRFGPNLQLAVRYEHAEHSHSGETTSADEHEDLGVGINYWFSPSFVLKVSYHRVDGNLFAAPEDEGTTLEPRTGAVFATAQFSF
jgi:hypothetical protein